MSRLIPGNQKHLTLDDRMFIERSLDEQASFKEIAKYLCKDPTTISKEVRLHRIQNTWNKGSFNNPYNFCIHRFHCRKTNVCDAARGWTRLPMSATAAGNRAIDARSQPNTSTTDAPHTDSTKNFSAVPEKEST